MVLARRGINSWPEPQVSASRMAGTFSFTAFRMVGVGQKVTVTVTDGTFNVPVILTD
jgi:hypothetical protein